MRSICGVANYDRLAVEENERFESFIRELEENGWIAKATDKLPEFTVAQFFPRKARFYCDLKRGRFST